MKLIFGLGNPGKEYDGTRHNVGFMALDSFAVKQTVGFVTKTKFSAEIAEIAMNGEKILLVKPTTYYNSVGESFQKIMSFYHLISEDCAVVHDELAIVFGAIRVRSGSSDAGNNGIKSINQHGGEKTTRIRVGVSNEKRQLIGDSDFVLGKFSKVEKEFFDTKLMSTIHALIEDFAAGKLEVTTHQVGE